MSHHKDKKEKILYYEEAGNDVIKLSRSFHVQFYLCEIAVVHTNGANAAFNKDHVFSMINKLEVVGNGRQTIKSIDGTKLALNTIMHYTMLPKTSLDTTEGTSKKSVAYFMLPLSMPNTVRPHETILHTRQYDELDMSISFSNDTSLGTNITIEKAQVQVISGSMVDYARGATEYIKFFKESQLNSPVVSTTTEHSIPLTVRRNYKQLTIVSTTDGVRSDEIIKNVRLVSGDITIIDIPYRFLQVLNEIQFKPEDKTSLVGVGVIDFARRGFLTDCLNTFDPKLNVFELVLDVEKIGTTDIRVYTDEFDLTNQLEAKV